MANVLDNLFGFLPVIIAVLWILRRVSARRSREQRNKVSTPSPLRTPSDSPEGEPAPESSRRRVAAKIQKVAKNALGGLSNEISSQRMGEEELYDRIRNRRVAAPPVAPLQGEVEATHRVLDASLNDAAPKTPFKTVSSMERIDKLPPVARGMVWSIILDEPPGMKDS